MFWGIDGCRPGAVQATFGQRSGNGGSVSHALTGNGLDNLGRLFNVNISRRDRRETIIYRVFNEGDRLVLTLYHLNGGARLVAPGAIGTFARGVIVRVVDGVAIVQILYSGSATLRRPRLRQC